MRGGRIAARMDIGEDRRNGRGNFSRGLGAAAKGGEVGGKGRIGKTKEAHGSIQSKNGGVASERLRAPPQDPPAVAGACLQAMCFPIVLVIVIFLVLTSVNQGIRDNENDYEKENDLETFASLRRRSLA
jgi:hypothetical protein